VQGAGCRVPDCKMKRAETILQIPDPSRHPAPGFRYRNVLKCQHDWREGVARDAKGDDKLGWTIGGRGPERRGRP